MLQNCPTYLIGKIVNVCKLIPKAENVFANLFFGSLLEDHTNCTLPEMNISMKCKGMN